MFETDTFADKVVLGIYIFFIAYFALFVLYCFWLCIRECWKKYYQRRSRTSENLGEHPDIPLYQKYHKYLGD